MVRLLIWWLASSKANILREPGGSSTAFSYLGLEVMQSLPPHSVDYKIVLCLAQFQEEGNWIPPLEGEVARTYFWGTCRVGDIIVAIFDRYNLHWWYKLYINFCHTGDKGRDPWKEIPTFKLKRTVNSICDKTLNVYIFFLLEESRRSTMESLYQTSEFSEEDLSGYDKSS